MIELIRDLRRLHAAYANEGLDPAALVRALNPAINNANRSEVFIHRIPLELLLERAAELNAIRAVSGKLPPLFGVPFVIKDNIDVAGIPTTAACPAYSYVPAESAPVVKRLLDAGAILIGKTNMDQFATGLVGTRSPYGACRNWFNPQYISGGSSSGSAVAVAAGWCTFSLGTDTAGSGRVPAAFQNIYGLKPSRGLLSTQGVVPACRSLDCVSIFANGSCDALSILEIAADEIPNTRFQESFLFGVPVSNQLEFFGDMESERLYQIAVARMEALGGKKIEVDLAPFRRATELLYGGPFLAERYAAVGTFIEEHPGAIDPTVREIILAGNRFSAAELFIAMEQLEALKYETSGVWLEIDFLFLPTAPTIYTIAQIEADPVALNARLGIYTNFVNLLGLSALAIPGGIRTDNGVPFGVTMIAPAGEDAALCRFAERLSNEVSSDISPSREAASAQ